VALTEYPDAHHGFDNPLSPRLLPVRDAWLGVTRFSRR